jgi:hypothetical protein
VLRRLSLLLFAGLAAGQEPLPVVRHVLPKESELAWRSIDWKPTLWDAVIEAHASRKPILLWAMNGHPLGLT